jgi:hypothetical protein
MEQSFVTLLGAAAAVSGLHYFYSIKNAQQLIDIGLYAAKTHLKCGDFKSFCAFLSVCDSISKKPKKVLISSLKQLDADPDVLSQAEFKKRISRLIITIRLHKASAIPWQKQKNRLQNVCTEWVQVIDKCEVHKAKGIFEQSTANSNPLDSPTIHVIAVAFERFNELKLFVQSWINQTEDNWKLTVIHDGPNDEFQNLMSSFKNLRPNHIEHFCSEQRFDDYGHTLRDIGLKQVEDEYVLLTNSDNYFIPKAIEFINQKLFELNNEIDVLMFDLVHSHDFPGGRRLPSYSFFEVFYKRGSIDVSAAIVKSDLAKKVGFRDKTHDGDATYFEDIQKIKSPGKLSVEKVPKVLLVHN